MKKHTAFFLIINLCSVFIIAQDTIVFRTGEKQEVVVKKIGVDIIEYIRYDNQNGPMYETEKSQISWIKYANGTSDNFESYIKKQVNEEIVNTFIDERDGEEYRYVKIGDQVWMVDNLRYNDGRSPEYGTESEYCEDCGRYYNFDDAYEACPKGWHLASDEEWRDLEVEVGMHRAEVSKMGWRGSAGGQSHHLLEKGSSGLELLLCGYMIQTNLSKKKPKFGGININKEAYYWTSSEYSSFYKFGYYRKLSGRRSILRENEKKDKRFSVRCLKDNLEINQ